MKVKVLGEFVARIGDDALHLGTPKQKAVFAMLAVHPGQLVSVAELVDELWPHEPPRSAVPNVRTYAANLRRLFESDPSGQGILVREGGGYRLDLESESIDLFAFQADCAEARRRLDAGDLGLAAVLLEKAVARWRGSMLSGLPLGPVLASRVAATDEQRLLAVELLADVRIRLGGSEQAVPLLRNVLASHQLRESAHVLLVQALRQQGDHAGALAAYESARRALLSQLGIEPGPELRRLHRMLAGAAMRPSGASSSHSPRPRAAIGEVRASTPSNWLPRAVSDFVGRADAVARLIAETRRVEHRASAVHLIDGMAGSGKSALAVHLARQLAAGYQDAQLFIDLRGHGDEAPVEPGTALATLLRQLRVPGGRIPVETEYRAELWRRELASRRAVVVLDNAANGEQVRPLLPALPGAVVIVTSRRRLTGLDVGPPESLTVMTAQEGIALLAMAVGSDRVDAEPEAAASVVQRCGYLPLAIRLAGSRLANRPSWRIADFEQLLADGGAGLTQLAVEDRTVAGAFATSYEPLSASTKRLFRLLSLHPGSHFGLVVGAALADLKIAAAERALNELVDGHLVEEVANGRYRMHDLIRRYAAELTATLDSADERNRALSRLLDTSLHAVLAVADVLEPGVSREQVAVPLPSRPDLLAALGAHSAEWLEAERSNIVALVTSAVESGHHDLAWRLARGIWRFCYIRSYFDDIVLTHTHGLAAATAAGDLNGMATMNNYLASAYVRRGMYLSALEHLTAAVSLCEQLGSHRYLVRYRANLVVVYWLRGDLHKAVAVGFESLRELKGYEPDDFPISLPNLGLALTTLGRFEEALYLHRLHLYWARVTGNYFHTLNALSHIGFIKNSMGRHVQAIRLLRASLALRDRTGHRYAEAEVQNGLGNALRGLGRLSEAVEHHETALRLVADSGERHVEAATLNDLGLTLAEMRRHDKSAEMHRRALQLSTRIAHPYEQGRALAGLAEHHAGSALAEARRYWERALVIFRRMGVPERVDVERRLGETAPVPVEQR